MRLSVVLSVRKAVRQILQNLFYLQIPCIGRVNSIAGFEGHVIKTLIFTGNIKNLGRDSSVGIATRYGLDGPGIECR